MQGYFKNLNLKESCYTCAYKNGKSASHITLGDFWGVDKLYPDFYDYYGNSIMVINSQKGQDLLNRISNELNLLEIKEEDILKYNSGLIKPFEPNNDRENYFKMAKKQGYIKPLEKYLYGTGMRKIKHYIKILLVKK